MFIFGKSVSLPSSPLLICALSLVPSPWEMPPLPSIGMLVSGCNAVQGGAAGPLLAEGFMAPECHHSGLGSLRPSQVFAEAPTLFSSVPTGIPGQVGEELGPHGDAGER